MFNDFDNWGDCLSEKLTGVLLLIPLVRSVANPPSAQVYHIKSPATVSSIEIKETSAGIERAATLRQTDAALGEVISNTILTAPGKPVKRHLGETLNP